MGIDVETFTRLGSDPAVLSEVPRIRAVPGMRASSASLLLGVDRLDYTKGIPQRLLAFECLLERHPELHGRVSLLQVAVPSREEIGAYRDLREVVEALVARINHAHRQRNWTPVTYLYGTVDLNTLAAFYRAADVMVVTPLRDGLNLVAKEFIATRVDENAVLILSKYAGAAAELQSAVVVNPNHVGELAEAYHRALRMPATERRRRMRALRRVIASNHVIDWASEFLDHLRDWGRPGHRRQGGRGLYERGFLRDGTRAWRASGPASNPLPRQ
jgi:trehalose 6-phosphate synthase/phosphatase